MSTEKEQKKLKKSKEHRKKSDAPAEVEAEVFDDSDNVLEEPTPADAVDENVDEIRRKRKRNTTQEDELEIDVNLPEPPSKKALRKAKRQKSKPEQDTEEVDGHAAQDAAHAQAATASTTTQTGGKKDSAYGIWIGNLPFTITKQLLSDFFTSNAKNGAIPPTAITRVHMPAPPPAPVRKGADKPVNKGFAYVDFSSKAALDAAMELSETSYGGRNVLIKEAKNFEGRPKDHGAEKLATSQSGPAVAKKQNPTRRIFVGNLGFDCTKEDLSDHFVQCGSIDNVHMATFQDTGKCKGFAWVTFNTEEAAEAAARGFVFKQEENDGDDPAQASGGDEDAAVKSKTQKKPRGRKWFVNRLLGRPLRIELAEDASTRYEKRFGKGTRPRGQETNGNGTEETTAQEETSGRPKGFKAKRDAAKKAGNSSSAYGGDGDSKYRTGGIVAASGQKVTFDD